MLPPAEYIRGACRLHLQKEVISSDGPSQDAIDRFLEPDSGKGGGQDESSKSVVPRLFCWIQKSSSNILASTEAFEPNNLGAIVFVNSSGRKIRNINQIQCMTISPLRTVDGGEDKVEDSEVELEVESSNDPSDGNRNCDILLTLQLYARHCFAPTIQAMTNEQKSDENESGYVPSSSGSHESEILSNLQSKIRELDLTLSRARQSSLHSIPQVFLQTHPLLQSIEISSSSKIDLDALGLGGYVTDDTFLNEVQAKVNTWISLIRKVTTLPSSHTFSQNDLEEVSYWANLHSSLEHIREELGKPSTVLTLNLLKSAKRFVTTIALENNTGLDSAEAIVGDVHNFLKGYPAESLASAGNWDQIMNSMEQIFDHLPKVRQSRYYGLKVVDLLEASTATLKDRIDYTLRNEYKSNGIILIPYERYEKLVYGPTQDIFVRFEDLYNRFVEFVLDFGRKRNLGGDKTPAQIVKEMTLHHIPLKERLDAIHTFRSQHEKLHSVVSEVLMGVDDGNEEDGQGSATTAIREVEEAPASIFASIDLLDLTDKGQVAFDAALENYERKIDMIEERLAKLLRSKLTACEDAEDMFAVFARFNPLLARASIQNAVKEFQIELISTVAKAIERLQAKFTHKYESSSASRISRVRGIPPVSGKILWAKHIERQVNTLMKRMGDVLGPSWGQHLEGRQLRRSGEELLSKLDAKAFFRSWVSDWEREMSIEATSASTRLNSYPIKIDREASNGALVATVNFNEKYELLFREIRYLEWMGFERDIPRTLTLASQENLVRYPYAMALRAALRSYSVAREFITPELEPLVKSHLCSIRDSIAEAFGVTLDGNSRPSSTQRIRWGTKELGVWVAGLTELVTRFEERVEILSQVCQKVEACLDALGEIKYDHHAFTSLLEDIQKLIDQLSLAGFTELNTWVVVINTRISLVLQKRLDDAIEDWNNFFDAKADLKNEKNEEKKDALSTSPVLRINPMEIEILLTNQEIVSFPCLPFVRSKFLEEFHKYIGTICSLKCPQSGRFDVFESHAVSGNNEYPKTFGYLIHNMNSTKLAKAYGYIEDLIHSVSSFVTQWLAYQTLWDTRVLDVADTIGDSIELWQNILQDAAAARKTLDSSLTSSQFGPITVHFEKVQSQINFKYDSWQKELQTYFAKVVGQKIVRLHEMVSTSKEQLEDITLDNGAPTEDIVLGVTYIQEMKLKIEPWGNEVEALIYAERSLRRSRHTFPSDWLEGSRLKGQFHQLDQILHKRGRAMNDQLPLLQSRVISEEKVANSKISEILMSWEEEKPLRGNIDPTNAIELLSKYEFTIKKAKADDENLLKAKDALGLNISTSNSAILNCYEELLDLKEVWNAIALPYEKLNEVKATPWNVVIARDIRKQLEDILQEMRSLPNKIRQFDAFAQLNDLIKGYLLGNGAISDLKNEALKERHWKQILSTLGINSSINELTIGLLWNHGIVNRRKSVNEILTTAQGEMALESFLDQVRNKWMKQELELVLYQNRVRLIKGWDNLFAALDDHLAGLVLMKSSPYYRAVREFQEEGKLWEDRLTKLRGAFDSWVDVQRRWVYLEGIFLGNADIKAQLPSEWSRFRNVDGEFIALMRLVSNRPYAMEALDIENLQKTLERLESLMIAIQRALGEYLSKQRSDFSRFYFLGDDDLLEILGNSGEPGKVLSHLGKMFAALGSLCARSSSSQDGLIGLFDTMMSKDGELVPLHDVIKIASKSTVKDWLEKLESGMHNTLASLLFDAVMEDSSSSIQLDDHSKKSNFIEWAEKFPAQVMILASLINWSMNIDKALDEFGDSRPSLLRVLSSVERKLEIMAETVLIDLPPESRKKFEQLITELVHQRDVTCSLLKDQVNNASDFRWLYHLRFKYNPDAALLTEKLQISLSNASFYYGFEYLGIGDRLVQTPLTDRCYLTLTQALHFRMGGNPFGPAGTGKTETVKALGAQLGRFVVVMNCDETFDFASMGRIFCGLCQVGAWGCFDEFNRLEERILSAVSQQILTIQRGLVERQAAIELLGQSIKLHENVGIFVTMNPGYAGRSNLPDNLKTLFRSVAMVKPDSKLIAQVMLYSQGIVSAQNLSSKIVAMFKLCQSHMSTQSHYDFSLRALKSLLVSAGGLKRKMLEDKRVSSSEDITSTEISVMVESACNNILPKLVADDIHVFPSVLNEVFPGFSVSKMEDMRLREKLVTICKSCCFVPGEEWVQKVLQLKQVLEMRHGVMIVGPSGTGKSSALSVLLQGLQELDGVHNEKYVIDPKAMNKNSLYGELDSTTMEWTDGVFTSLLRKILSNQKGESDKRHYIIFDGDVDPEWAENLNSVLDDNKLLTLPSGERLSIPENVRIVLEVDSLAQATPATVSRCGMVWFSEETVTTYMVTKHLYNSLLKQSISEISAAVPQAQRTFLECIKHLMISDDEDSQNVISEALRVALTINNVMKPTREGFFTSLKALLMKGIEMVINYNENHPDFLMSGEHMTNFAQRWFIHSLLWSFAGSAPWADRQKFSDLVIQNTGLTLPLAGSSISDYRVRVEDGDYELWSESVPRMEIESHKVVSSDVVITTTDTIRHSDVLEAWLSSRMPLILCGPPGSGKTMTLTSVLQSIRGIVLANLNFSSRTTPEIILKTFRQYCSYVRKGKDIVLQPSESLGANSWLVIFCDEINLPENDSYGTQRVIMFMRQLVEQNGFWRDDNTWVKIHRIQFVGACNPPTDAGRVVMSSRFLRHAPLLLVDFPEKDSLLQIYSTFNRGMLKLFPNLKGETDALTHAMVELYCEVREKFTPDIQPQYFYSPRELSRWVRGIYEGVVEVDALTREELVRIWAHEALRLFCDRLVDEEERAWCEDQIDIIARKHFAGVDHTEALVRPIYYSSWMSRDTRRVGREELKAFVAARLSVFYEEELDVPLVIFDEVLEHILRIDRVLRQPMGHCLLVGDSGAGKTVLSKFVSWMNGLSIFQIKAHSKYDVEDFNEDLRSVMRRVGVEGEKICFIFDESNALGSGFLEAMNALLASGEVPGLFEGDEYTSLINSFRESQNRNGIIIGSEEELWRRFTAIIQRNLHVVFTMNPSGGEWRNRSTTSPALFNRCVVDWFGTWSQKALGEVAKEFTLKLDFGETETIGGSYGIGDGVLIMNEVSSLFEGNTKNSLRHAVVAALVAIHKIAKMTAEECADTLSNTSRTFMSPRDFLALIRNFVSCVRKMREQMEDEQLHVNAGLEKLRQTQESVAQLKIALGEKKDDLREKEELANQKLQQMVADQNEAEKRKEEANRTSLELAKQSEQIAARREEAQRDLDEAEPALKAAQAAVKDIKKKDLDEVRNLLRPPSNVVATLECIAIMLGETNLEWAHVRKLLSKADFIPSILNFAVEDLSAKQVKLVQTKYLDGNDELNYDIVMRSSKACGPLYKWAESQVKYSTVYNRVQPLRDEVERLEAESSNAVDRKRMLEDEIMNLEESIAQYKTDYATLIRDVESLKAEMKAVTKKVERAESLIKSLSKERERWSKSSEGFEQVLRNLIGDGLLMAAFLTYSGFFDFKARFALMSRWQGTIEVLGIDFRPALSLVEVLSKASDRLKWQSQGLPSDLLSIENGVILDHCVRFPYIIDPSGYAIEFALKKFSPEKIQKTSFLDKAFTKTLAGAVRFGTTLLVENVESIDPILNPILNKEIQRTGGRSLVRIGTEDVDYSPKFTIILTTKNPGVKLTPDICSRVTLINFTVTPASLHSQSLSLILKRDKPDVEEQRINLLKLQGEQQVKLRELEEQMLSKISAVEGSILDDDHVVDGMEFLMKEGSQVEEQIANSAIVMKKVQQAITEYEPLADICKKLYVLLKSLRDFSFLYEFSAQAFMKTLESALNEALQGTNGTERIGRINRSLFVEFAARFGRGLIAEDQMTFGILLSKLVKNDLDLPEETCSIETISECISSVFGKQFPWRGRGLNDLVHVTQTEIDSSTPLLLCSAPGHDVSGRVESIARKMGHEMESVAMGSIEGFVTAERMLMTASKRGTWVLLKNCHLCTEWLENTLVKKLQSLGSGSNPKFRLFLTSEINPKLPTALLQLSDVIVAEAPSGIKASLTRFFSNISSERLNNPLRNRLYLLLGWIHSVIQERLRYVPSGWSEAYEFTESDALHALDVIDALLDDASGGKQTSDPEKLPWDAIRTTLCKSIFGGRITQDNDQKILDDLVSSVFLPDSFDVNFKLVDGEDSLCLPDGTTMKECMGWIENLSEYTPPTWIGLDGSAETIRSRTIAKLVLSKVDKMQNTISYD
mmetsp:Transcript_17192/g.32539  ORF Transcript_17192/g.32539 Transcript_17192/m.32539 type:complete len:4250 (-) Transcript_17192:45-12794(-)